MNYIPVLARNASICKIIFRGLCAGLLGTQSGPVGDDDAGASQLICVELVGAGDHVSGGAKGHREGVFADLVHFCLSVNSLR